MSDFLNKVKINRSAMVQLIKAGAFDALEQSPRTLIMATYIWKTCEKKSRLTLQNFAGLIKADLVPEELTHQIRVFNFTKYIKAACKYNTEEYKIDDSVLDFLSRFYNNESLFYLKNNTYYMLVKNWENIYQKEMNVAREWLKENSEKILKEYNKIIFLEDWKKYGKKNLAAWEMESVCFYSHPHELSKVDYSKYQISVFDSLPETPFVAKYFTRNKVQIPIFETTKIIGTVLDKNKTKGIVTILTPEGTVVNVKFSKEYFSMFDKQISEKQIDGRKKIKEKSWFNRGEMIMVNGFRRDDTFVAKAYKSDNVHQLYKITEVVNNGTLLELTHDRYNVEDNGEDNV